MYKDYFSLFNLSMCFNIDLNLLEQNYISLQSANHPDRFSLSDEKKLAAEKIMEVNQAYQVLRSPLKRAEYILKAKKIELSHNDTNQIIAEIMEIQESQIEQNFQEQIDKCLKNLQTAFASEDFYQAAQQALQLNYLSKAFKKSRLISNATN